MSGNQNEGNAPTDPEKLLGESVMAARTTAGANGGGPEYCPPTDFAPSEVDKLPQSEVQASPQPMLLHETSTLDAAGHPLAADAGIDGEGHFTGHAQLPGPDDFSDLLAIDWNQEDAGISPDAALIEAFAKTQQRAALAGFDARPDGQRLPFKATLTEEQLLRIDNLLLATYDDIGRQPCLARLVVFDDHLLIQANSVISILQHEVHLDKPTGLAKSARTTFYFATNDLHQAMKARDGQATLAWESGEALIFASGLFERDVALRPPQQFHRLTEPIVTQLSGAPIGRVPIDALCAALRYGWPLLDGFNKKTFDRAVIETADAGTVCIGQPGAMAVISAQSLQNIVYSIRCKQASALKSALTALEHPSELFQDKRHYILWDGLTAVGFDSEPRSLADAKKKWEAADWGPVIVIPRNQFLYAVRQVAILAGSGDFELQVKGAGTIAFVVSASSSKRRRARTTLEGFAQSIIPLTRLALPVWPTLAALQAQETVNACIRVSSLGLMIDDRDDAPSGRHFINGKKASSAK